LITTTVSSPAAATSWTSYDNVGNVIGSKDALGRITSSTYDKLNRQTSVTKAVGTVDETTNHYQYDKVGNLLEETNGRGYITKSDYDALNRQTQVVYAYDSQTPVGYFDVQTEYFDTPALVSTVLAELPLVSASVGNVVKTTDALGNATYILYDKFGRQIATYDAIKHRTSGSKYDSIDRVIESTDTFGQNTIYAYTDDPNLRVSRKVTVDPLGVMRTEGFDVAGNLVNFTDVVGGVNRTTHYDYDGRKRRLKVTDAEGGVTEYSYYDDGLTKSVFDAALNLTEYFYDEGGRLSEDKTFFGSRKYKYDLVNNRISAEDRNERVTNYGYDNLNRVKSETWVGDGKQFTYSYDENSNLITALDGNIKYVYGYDDTDLVTSVDRIQTGNPLVRFEYTYDDICNLTQTEELVGSVIRATTAYEYNDPRYLNTKITQTGTGLRSKEVKFTYDAAGLNTKIERYLDGLLKVTTTNAFDPFGRLTGIEQKNGGGIIAESSYDLDALSRLRSETKDGLNRAIGYDDTDQVVGVSGSNSEGYTYDLNGNRTGGGYSTGAGNRLLSDGVYNYVYDDDGNRISRTNIVSGAVDEYAWDYRNRLMGIVSKTSITGTVTRTVGYEYDVDDQRVQKTVDGVVENYYLDGNQIAFVTDGNGNQIHYLYGLNVDAVMAQDSPAGMVWALADRLGSIDTLTDADGVVVDKRTFDSFGRILSETNPSVSFRYGYTGRERDLESGLDYYRARYYDPQVGRFISVDPMGFGAGDTNLYRYVGNSSTNANDPSGEFWNFVGGAAIGAVLDVGFQVYENWGTGKGIDLTRVAISAVAGAVGGGIGGALGKGGALLKGAGLFTEHALVDTGLSLGTRTAINAGVGFNLGYWGKVTENKVGGKELFDGALFTGIAGGIGAGAGELLQAGIGAAWKSNAVQSRLAKFDAFATKTWNTNKIKFDSSSLGTSLKQFREDWGKIWEGTGRSELDWLEQIQKENGIKNIEDISGIAGIHSVDIIDKGKNGIAKRVRIKMDEYQGTSRGETDMFGNATIDLRQESNLHVRQTSYHEDFHGFFSVNRTSPFAHSRATFSQYMYKNNQLLRWAEEAGAEAYSLIRTRKVGSSTMKIETALNEGRKFPMEKDYGINGKTVSKQFAALTAVTGTALYGSYKYGESLANNNN
jgi:RHS repeat-associated protein